MSHHYSGPNFGFPHGDARLDLTDVYAFGKPGDAGKSILIMNFHPSATAQPIAPTRGEPFADEALYELKIDTDGDALADIAYRVRFSPFKDGAQTATVLRATGAEAAGTGDSGELLIDRAPVSMGAQAHISEGGGHRFFAGLRSDAFFFDVEGVLADFKFTGRDFFADKNISSIALEIPNASFGGGKLGIWARSLDAAGGIWVQADRGARPAQTPFLAGEANAAYLAGEPRDDAQFIPVFAHALEHAGGYAPADAERVARTLLPDMVPFDPTRPVSFPENGRLPTDDTQDYFLGILTNGKVTTDHIGPHSDLLADFPYLGPPHAPVPAQAAA